MFKALLLVSMFVVALFLILLILVQRGKGGGLAGAFGGMGGQSAFGTKAGDLFTKITIVVATVWIVLCILGVKFLGTTQSRVDTDMGSGAAPVRESTEPGPAGAAPAESSAPSPESGD
jgi:preprotein translocase subunit SecG